MSVDVPLLDNDHQGLIGIINELHAAIDSNEEGAKLAKILEKIDSYIEFHFAREEKVLEACGYPHCEAHSAGHSAFGRQIKDVRERHAQNGNGTNARELLDFLDNWLTDHILIRDKEYKSFTDRNRTVANQVASVFGPGLADRIATSDRR